MQVRFCFKETRISLRTAPYVACEADAFEDFSSWTDANGLIWLLLIPSFYIHLTRAPIRIFYIFTLSSIIINESDMINSPLSTTFAQAKTWRLPLQGKVNTEHHKAIRADYHSSPLCLEVEKKGTCCLTHKHASKSRRLSSHKSCFYFLFDTFFFKTKLCSRV